jgi:hypothetical protein
MDAANKLPTPCMFYKGKECPGHCLVHTPMESKIEETIRGKKVTRDAFIRRWNADSRIGQASNVLRRIMPVSFAECKHNLVI